MCGGLTPRSSRDDGNLAGESRAQRHARYERGGARGCGRHVARCSTYLTLTYVENPRGEERVSGAPRVSCLGILGRGLQVSTYRIIGVCHTKHPDPVLARVSQPGKIREALPCCMNQSDNL